MSATTEKRAKSVKPVTVFVSSVAEAKKMESEHKNSRAITSGIGTLKFHHLIAAHGAGDFQILFCPNEFEGQWKPPVGGKVVRT